MTRQKQLAATLMGALTVQTVGAVSPPATSLPSPRAYVAIYTLWGILGLIAEAGTTAAEWAARLSMLVLLTATVAGPFGKKIVDFMGTVSKRFAIAPPGQAGTEAPKGGVI